MEHRKGFTLVELIVVIVVIAILATVTAFGLTGYQKDARDNQRQARATTIAEALEKYYDTHGEYPSCADLTQSLTATASELSISQDILITPNSTDKTANAVKCQDFTSSTGDIFAYIGDGSADCQTTSCLQFTLKYKEEATGTIKTITSRRTAAIATSGRIELTGTPSGYSTINLAWNTIPNSTGYILQRSTSTTFSSPTQNSFDTNTAAYSATGLVSAQTYYFRIKSTSPVGDTEWSQISATTNRLATPTGISATTNRATVINVTWNTVTNATSYKVERSTSSSFPAGSTTSATVTPNSYSSTGETPGVTAYFRVTAIRSDSTSLPSASDSAVTVVAPPSDPTISIADGSSITGTMGVVTCADGSPEYSIRYHREKDAANGAWSGFTTWSSTRTFSTTRYQGNRYGMQGQVRCNLSGNVSTTKTSGEVQMAPDIATPPAPTIVTDGSPWGNRTYHVVNYNTSCPAETYVSHGNWTSVGFTGAVFTHGWGFNDWWENPNSYADTVSYSANYSCFTAFKSSGTSQSSYNVITVNP